MCRGAIFLQFVRVSKKGFRKNYAFFVFVLFLLEKEMTKAENMEKENKKRKIMFLGGCERKSAFCCKNSIF